MTKRLALAVLALVLAMSLLAGCGPKEDPEASKKGGIFEDYMTSDPKGLDVQESTMLVNYELARLMFSTLVRYKGATTELEPELLAKMPTVSADGLTYTFELRKGVKFHDGKTVLKSDDVKFSIERMLSPEAKGLSAWLFEPIKGAQEIIDGNSTSLEGYKKIDDQKFELTLLEPYAPFLQNLAVPSASIYSESIVKAAGEDFSINPVGTGPFKLKKYSPQDEIVLEKNPDYFEEGLPYLDGVRYRILASTTAIMEFENNTLDIVAVGVEDHNRFVESKLYTLLEANPLNTYYFLINQSNEAWSDVRIRKALALSFNKEEFVESFYPGGRATVATSFVTPGIPGAYEMGKGPGYSYDLEAAKALVAEVQAETGKTVAVEAWQRGGGDTIGDANLAFQAMAKEAGIELKIIPVESGVFNSSRRQGTIPANYGNWWADIPDADNYIGTFFARGNQMSSGYNNSDIQDKIEEAKIEVDPANRAKLYQEIEVSLIKDEVAVIPLFHTKQFRFVHPSVKGVIMHPTGIVMVSTAYKETPKK